MKKFIEKFKQASMAKKIVLITAVAYIVVMFIYKFVMNDAVLQLGIPYFITTAAVYLVRITIILLAVKVASVIIEKIRNSKR